MTNIKCNSGHEIDLLAMNPKTLKKYHIESRVSTSFKLKELATRKKKGASHRNGLDYFDTEKFGHISIKAKIKEVLGNGVYHKVLVVWDVEDIAVIKIAKEKYNIEIWFIDDLIKNLITKGNISGSRDDILRVVDMISVSQKKGIKNKRLGDRISKAVEVEKVMLLNPDTDT